MWGQPLTWDTVNNDGQINGLELGFLARGIGLGLFGQGTGTALGPITTLPPFEQNPCEH
jgi:hypothetical protein